MVIGTIIGAVKDAPEDALTTVEFGARPPLTLLETVVPGGVYKARPLNGIWATAPYLHNGSVPNLYQLLLPAEDRDATFTVGSRQFDPKHVGYRTDAPGVFTFRARDENGETIPGNSNAGHEYGELSEQERWELVEYLKTL